MNVIWILVALVIANGVGLLMINQMSNKLHKITMASLHMMHIHAMHKTLDETK